MAPVYREVILEWGGKTYTVTPTYALIQRLEQKLSLASLLNRVLGGEAPLSQVADLIAMTLSAAGCKDASAEDINAQLYEGGETTSRIMAAGSQILVALLPQRKLPGNAPAPAPAAGAAGSTTSTGASTSRSPSDTSESSPPSSGG